jgi:hypothetical protein
MVNFDRAFTVVNGISLSNYLGIFEGTGNPSLTGETAPVGSLFIRGDVPQIWHKQDTADVDWERLPNLQDVLFVSGTVSGLVLDVATISGDISSLSADVSGNTISINTISGDLVNLTSDVQQNSADILDRVQWVYPPKSIGSQYFKNEMTRDGEWTMIANVDTTDRPAPVPSGYLQYVLDNDPVFIENQISGVVWSGHKYAFNKSGWVRSIRAYVSELTSTTNYRFILINETNPSIPIVNIINEPVLVADQWATIALGNTLVVSGDIYSIYIDALNSSGNTTVAGGWTYDGVDNNNAPSTESWNRNNQHTIVRVNKDDLDSIDRSTELLGIVAGSLIRFSETLTPSLFFEYLVTNVIDSGSDVVYSVILQNTGGVGPTQSQATTMNATVPVPQTTKYVEDIGYFTTSGNTSFAGVSGVKRLSGVFSSGVEDNAYGIDITFQEAYVSPDWDLVAVTDGGNSAGAGGSGTLQALNSVLSAGNLTDGNDIILSSGDQISGLVGNGIIYPITDGNPNDVITTNGSNIATFTSVSDIISGDINALSGDIINNTNDIAIMSGDIIYLSGQISGGGGAQVLDDLDDVDTTTNLPITGDFLRYVGNAIPGISGWVPSSTPELSAIPVSNNLVWAYDTLIQTLSAINTFQIITFDEIVVAEGWTYSNGNFTSNTGGAFMATFEFNVEKNGGGNVEVTVKADKNNVEMAGSHNGMDVTSNNTAFSISRTFLFLTEPNDVINFKMAGNNTTARLVPAPVIGGITTPTGATLLIRRIV